MRSSLCYIVSLLSTAQVTECLLIACCIILTSNDTDDGLFELMDRTQAHRFTHDSRLPDVYTDLGAKNDEALQLERCMLQNDKF